MTADSSPRPETARAHDDSGSPEPSERSPGPDRTAVHGALDRVTDPELDRSIVELGYVDGVTTTRTESGVAVDVPLTLPTAWCSPAFAWMMATDAREAVEALPGVARCTVRLREHMHAAEITEGVNERRSFEAAFPDADGGVEEVRATLDAKARLARQHAAVEALLEAGLAPEQIAALRPDDVEFGGPTEETAIVAVRDRSLYVVAPADPLARYRRKAGELGLLVRGDPLFRTPEGDPIDADAFELVHRRTRLARVNMDGQGGVCDALHQARQESLAGDE